jgi:hypothetical protein
VAVVEGTLAEVDALLAAGADPNVALPVDTLPACISGLTALMAAVTNAYGENVISSRSVVFRLFHFNLP